jgi:hypothetical protein
VPNLARSLLTAGSSSAIGRACGSKRTGALCTCDRYEPVEQRLLVVKLDAMGDVLRSTALLPPLMEAHPRAAITWITRKESVPLLQRNPYVAEVRNGHGARSPSNADIRPGDQPGRVRISGAGPPLHDRAEKMALVDAGVRAADQRCGQTMAGSRDL